MVPLCPNPDYPIKRESTSTLVPLAMGLQQDLIQETSPSMAFSLESDAERVRGDVYHQGKGFRD